MGLKLVLVRTRHRAWMDREIGGAHMGKYWDRIWGNIPIAHKLFLEIALTAAALFASNLLIYAQINRMVVRMDSVYSSNVNLNELSDCLAGVQNYMYKYLEVKDSDSLTAYYKSEQEYRDLLDGLNRKVTDTQHV